MRPLDFSRAIDSLGNAAKFFGLGGAFAKLGIRRSAMDLTSAAAENSPV